MHAKWTVELLATNDGQGMCVRIVDGVGEYLYETAAGASGFRAVAAILENELEIYADAPPSGPTICADFATTRTRKAKRRNLSSRGRKATSRVRDASRG